MPSTPGERIEHVEGVLEMIQDTQQKHHLIGALGQEELTVEIHLVYLDGRTQRAMQRSNGAHLIVIGQRAIERLYAESDGLQKERQVTVLRSDIGYNATGNVERRSIRPSQ